MSKPTSEAILARLSRLHPKSIDLSLDRVERLLARLGHPERRLPPVVHIAGTNGKGSTLAMLAAMLAADGRRVHRYISPHLVRFNERILINGAPIDERRLAEALESCERANGATPITFFEITTAAAFLAFAENPADIVLLETGLGGRLDATNVVARPRLTLISPISMDHESYLGATLTAIAGEKAGILKADAPAIAGPQPAEVADVLDRRASAISAPLMLHGRDWSVERKGSGMVVAYRGSRLALPLPSLAGAYQVENAGLAVMAALSLDDLAPGRQSIEKGLRRAAWPARMQRLVRGPMVDALPAGSRLLLDGGHNPAAGEALARSLAGMPGAPSWTLVVGMLSTKDVLGFLRPLAPLASALIAVPLGEGHAGQLPRAIAEVGCSLGLPSEVAASPEAAIAAVPHGGHPVNVLICGSLYLAGEVLATNG
ncbi:MAG TPA: folylpolyglutamate synthase/dihydrofolate synthase family protein [Geminicoccaceae bacterium]|nr:folylpolyglutamate synthase/dihydrofolate synthase family protein [Geminicoccus sp.]HMU50057.1 folylpolyglutamate synthase/dihydrofolate synthase family protein [Geminicoccaceae bacterium]